MCFSQTFAISLCRAAQRNEPLVPLQPPPLTFLRVEVGEGKGTHFLRADTTFQSVTAQMPPERLPQTHLHTPTFPNLSRGGRKDVWPRPSEATVRAQASDKATSNPADSLGALPRISERSLSPRIFQHSHLLTENTRLQPQRVLSPLPVLEGESPCHPPVRETNSVTNLANARSAGDTPTFALLRWLAESHTRSPTS